MPPGASQSSGARPARKASARGAQPTSQDGSDPRSRARTASSRSSSPSAIHLSDLYRGHGRLGMIRDLAFGEFSHSEIAKDVGCTIADVREFEETYADEIIEVRAALAGHLAIETAGLWVSKKQNRLAELQSDVEDLNDVIASLRDTGRLGHKVHHDTVKVKISALRAAADELTPRGAAALRRETDKDDKNVVRYVIEDPDIEAMT